VGVVDITAISFTISFTFARIRGCFEISCKTKGNHTVVLQITFTYSYTPSLAKGVHITFQHVGFAGPVVPRHS